jgi:hypothetical protein
MALALVQQTTIGLNQEALDDWIEYRKTEHKPLSQTAINRVIKKLLRYPEDHQMLLVDHAIEHDWKGIYHVEPPKTKPQISGDTSWLGDLPTT